MKRTLDLYKFKEEFYLGLTEGYSLRAKLQEAFKQSSDFGKARGACIGRKVSKSMFATSEVSGRVHKF